MLDIITMFQPIYQKTFTELHLVGIKIMKPLSCQPEIINEFFFFSYPPAFLLQRYNRHSLLQDEIEAQS